MSQANLYNVPSNTLRPSSNLVIDQDPAGKTTASLMFTCRKGDVGGFVIQQLLRKGTKIDLLYPLIGSTYSFLEVDSHTARDMKGGYTEVDVSFIGYREPIEPESERSIVYSRTDSLRDESIFNHPKFKLLEANEQTGIREGSQNTARLVPSGLSNYVRRYIGDEYVCVLSEKGEKFWSYIVTQGNLTYSLPSSEWTKSATQLGKLSSDQINKLGLIDTPPGNPSIRNGQKWMFTGATESTTLIGDAPNSYTLTWSSGVWDEFIFTV